MLGLMIYSASMTYSKDRSIGKKDRLKIIQYGLNSYKSSTQNTAKLLLMEKTLQIRIFFDHFGL